MAPQREDIHVQISTTSAYIILAKKTLQLWFNQAIWDEEVSLNCPDGFNAITRILRNERAGGGEGGRVGLREEQLENARTHYCFPWRWRKGSGPQETQEAWEAGEAEGTDPALEPS